MDEDVRIVYVEKPDASLWGAINAGIHRYNATVVGGEQPRPLCFAMYTPDEEVAGGLVGETYWNWLFVDLLWVREDLRGRGYGSRLLALAEDEARRRGATNAYLDTFSFQAPDFYPRFGYRVFGVLQDFPPGHQRLFLTKQL